MTMKLNEVKHNHSLTDLLKIIIFSIIMMIPFFDVGTRCLYVICNKNAYQSYSNDNALSQISITTNTVEGLTYNLEYTSTTQSSDWSNIYDFSYISIDPTDYGFDNNTYNKFRVYSDGRFALLNINEVWNIQNNVWGNTLLQFTFISSGNNNVSIGGHSLLYKLVNTKDTLDNVFDYSVNKLSTNELYTWTQQTAIYTGVSTMTSQLGVQGIVIPILLTYWFILTVIYIVIDIVIKLFTFLTHAIGSKRA